MDDVDTGFPELLSWLSEMYPGLADRWIEQRMKYGNAAPDLKEWLSIVAPAVLKEYEQWESAHKAPVEEAPLDTIEHFVKLAHETVEQYDLILSRLNELIDLLIEAGDTIGPTLLAIEKLREEQE